MQDITYYRDKIDEIDQKIIDLLADRFTCVQAIGEIKKQEWTEIIQPARWENVLAGRKQYAATKNLPETFIEKIWNEIHDYAIKIQK